jgi:Mn2+/Fe2+ NRAMP family transporter
VVAAGVLMTAVDPVLVTEFSVVFSAIALPLTYFPILVIANDRDYMGAHANGRITNLLGTLFLILIVITAVAAVPLMVLSGAGR